MRALLWILLSIPLWAQAQERAQSRGEFPSGHAILKKGHFAWAAVSARQLTNTHFNHLTDPELIELEENNRLLLRGVELGGGKEFFLGWRLTTRSELAAFFAADGVKKNISRTRQGVRNEAIVHERFTKRGVAATQSLNVNFEAFKLIVAPYLKGGLLFDDFSSKLSYSTQDLGRPGYAYQINERGQNLSYILGSGLLLKSREDGFLFLEARMETPIESATETTAQQTAPVERNFAQENTNSKRDPLYAGILGIGFIF